MVEHTTKEAVETTTRVVTLEIQNGRLERVLIDGIEAHEVDPATRDGIFAHENGPQYVGTILYSQGMICVHRRCVLVCR